MFSSLLPVLLLRPSHGSEAFSCCPRVYTSVSSKHGILAISIYYPFCWHAVSGFSFVGYVVISGDTGRGGYRIQAHNFWHCKTDLWCCSSKSRARSHTYNEVYAMLEVICFACSLTLVLYHLSYTRQKSWSHPNSWRPGREYSWTLCSAEGNNSFLHSIEKLIFWLL